MKRHPSLRPLSRDHHHALVEAWNLSLAATGDPGSIIPAARRFYNFWQSDLRGHFSQEEQILLPLLEQWASPEDDPISQTLSQHAEIEGLVGQLDSLLIRGEAIEAGLLGALGESLRCHVRFEEQELFPAVEAAVPLGELKRMSDRLAESRAGAGFGDGALSPKTPPAEE
ncbi:MAG TPA: hemerythrin domain-containing protein [Blastocatellia bacterium]|nr:hemerythrin domain-containing protein [Blastocatellia bacterium]